MGATLRSIEMLFTADTRVLRHDLHARCRENTVRGPTFPLVIAPVGNIGAGTEFRASRGNAVAVPLSERAGHRPPYAFFRFPAVTCNAHTLVDAEALGLRVVHYRWEVGDPDPHETADRIVRETLEGTRPGWHTAGALPRMIEGLRAKGYRFVLLKDYLGRALQWRNSSPRTRS